MKRRTAIKLLGTGALATLVKPAFPIPFGLTDDFTAADFGADFKWGVATAAYQIEGGYNADGKGVSIWDTFTANPKNIKDQRNGNVACDFYNRYEGDIDFIRQMNMQVNRFSISWPRILPNGTGSVNQKGLDYYHRIIDTTLDKGLEPWITLYHWDLPQVLEDKGGWTNRDIVGWFSEYADVVTREYGDKVKNWMVLNEPMSYVGLGYFAGAHAPGRKGFKSFFPAVHHTVLAQAEGGRVIRRNVPDAQVGTTHFTAYIQPVDNDPKNVAAAERMDALINRLFIEPSLGLGYPYDKLDMSKKMAKYIKPGDEENMVFDFDFIGLQNYSRQVVQKAIFPPLLFAKEILPVDRGVTDITEMGWEVYPDGIYQMLKKFAAYDKVKKIIVTENGSAFDDVLDNGKVHDPKRIDFFKKYLSDILKAKREGVDVQGYLVWTLMDNFEWAEGFVPRFGLVHVDFDTQQRTLKDSGYWFRDLLAK